MGLNVGDPIPLFCQLADYDATKFVRAYVQDPDGNPVGASPFNLTPDASGGYKNFSILMPSVDWVHVNYLVFDDSGYTTLSVSEGGSSATFIRNLEIGDALPLFCQLATYDPDKFPQAVVLDATGTPIDDSPFDLVADDATGGYRNVAGIMTASPWLEVQYLVYDDSDHTELSDTDGGDSEAFFLTSAPIRQFPPTSNIVAFVKPDNCSEGPIEDTIVQGSKRILLIRLADDVGGSPFDLTDATAIVFRIRKTDGSILSVSLSDSIEVVNAGGGQIAVTLSAAQTALLAPAVPAPATIKVTIDAGVTVINLPTQLAVEEAEV